MPVLSRTRFLSVFDDWFLCNAQMSDAALKRSLWGTAVAEAPLPEEAELSVFCNALHDLIVFRRPLHFDITKSDYLFRRLHMGQAHRTEPCPEHLGAWSGVEMPREFPGSNFCVHGCGLSGWLPAKDSNV